jgi:CheY-like chemotaxis protein
MGEEIRQARILVVEDEAKVAGALREGLEREEYAVVVAPTGEEGFFLVNAEEFDLVILDLMLSGRDGLQVLSTLRKRGLQTPVLILTARDAIEDRVQGLDKGADDYLVKPFARRNPSLTFGNESPMKVSRQRKRRKCAFSIPGTPCTSGFIVMTLSLPGSSRRNSGAMSVKTWTITSRF